ncbi:hypothetical protein CC79DRAFT_908278 [Sarocladium strictum]
MGEVISKLEFSSEGEKEIWVNESKRWRLPYWDWAVNTSLPQLFREKTVNIREPLKTPDTQATSIPVSNPLYRFEMKVDGKVTKMGNLEQVPINYSVNDVPDGDDILPVQRDPRYDSQDDSFTDICRWLVLVVEMLGHQQMGHHQRCSH